MLKEGFELSLFSSGSLAEYREWIAGDYIFFKWDKDKFVSNVSFDSFELIEEQEDIEKEEE